MYRLCPGCRKRIDAKLEICPLCGAEAKTVQKADKALGRNRVLALQVAVLPLVVGLVFLLMFLTNSLFFSSEEDAAKKWTAFEAALPETQAQDELIEADDEGEFVEEEAPQVEEAEAVPAQVGDIVYFGSHKWRILDIAGPWALVISEYVIFSRPFHHSFQNVTWETSSLRQYLNSDFLRSMSRREQARISDAAGDRVFLLSVDEVLRYFGDSGLLQAGALAMLSDEYDEARIAQNMQGEPSWWWLRTSGSIPSLAAFVDEHGHLYLMGFTVSWSGGGVRPAMWILLEP